jgi:hypothetical protein
MVSDFDDEPSLAREAIERRGDPRGLMRDLAVELSGLGRCDAIEASRKGFFVAIPDPEVYRLGEVIDVGVVRRDQSLRCKVEVVRKEIFPRCGVALRIVHLTPVAEETLRAMLEA